VRISEAPQFKPAQFTILGWEVTDIQNIVVEMQKKGIHFERYGFIEQDELGIWTAPTGDKVTWFKDPDGNVLSVSQHV
ncbi:MAG: VOC family protein, partial [Candidatus Sulfotelmatobacter sp.]